MEALNRTELPRHLAGRRQRRCSARYRSRPERPDGAGNSFHRRGAEQGQLQDVARHDGDKHCRERVSRNALRKILSVLMLTYDLGEVGMHLREQFLEPLGQ